MKEEFLTGKEIPEVSNAEMSFGVSSLSNFPAYDEIPKDFHHGHTKWNRLFNEWFFLGLESMEVTPKNAVDKEKALRYIKAHMKTWNSKHEHKEDGIAYVMSLWFEDATWTINK